ncbi:hypothetical protein SLA2020_335810 [Shorea laevis]
MCSSPFGCSLLSPFIRSFVGFSIRQAHWILFVVQDYPTPQERGHDVWFCASTGPKLSPTPSANGGQTVAREIGSRFALIPKIWCSPQLSRNHQNDLQFYRKIVLKLLVH